MIDEQKELVGKKLGRAIRDARIHHFFDTQKTMALRIGVSLSTYAKMEDGDTSVAFAAWISAAWIIGKLDQLGSAFEHKSLFDYPNKSKIIKRVRKKIPKS